MPITTSEPPPPKSASRLIGGTGAPPSGPMCHEHARDREVVDVVADVARERAVLAPPGHARVHEPRVARPARVGPDAEPFGDTGPEALRAARRPARRGAAPPRRRARASGRCRRCAGRGRSPSTATRTRRRSNRWRRRSRGRGAAPRRPCRRAACPRTAPARCSAARCTRIPASGPVRVRGLTGA